MKKNRIPNNQCEICKWVGPCDRHRIQFGGDYIVQNVVSLCPNCHRLFHLGLLSIESLSEAGAETTRPLI